MSDGRDQTWTLRKILDWCVQYFDRKGVDSPRLSAEMLLAHVLKCQRIKLYTDLHRPMIESELAAIREIVRRAADHEPIQYLVGKTSFYNLEIEVNRDVLVPRNDTETLVERVLTHLKVAGVAEPRVLDLCTGSGCVAAAIAAHHKTAVVVAADVSLPAIDVARRNIARLNLDSRVTCVTGDLYAALDGMVDARPFHVIVANPPYIRSAEIARLDRNVRDFEPHLALDGGTDGLDPHRKIIARAVEKLEPAGRVFLEIAFDQEEPALWILKNQPGLDDPRSYRDLAGQPRVVSARRA